ncbi:MAG TPA: type II toxin-antitoxin system RelE/ParE family toxin [Luteimonas sp.]|nr:type II toxin-antitoxin system RelE/ParE family toxin [Luteimonas sp.]HRO26926.1 type II toxin-antitoxin system RelE/ParE family toxin [Luteimonas sp.]HRP71654.1 type II toxin-antitoxin system RelE/ParE family toxin [Luteimonas sp.]
MSKASSRADARAGPRIERYQSWIAALLSVLWHLLLLVIAMLSPPITVSTPAGADAGGTMLAEYVGVTPPPPVPAPVTAPPSEPARPSRAPSRLRVTQVERADDPVPHEVPDDAAQTRPPAPAAAAPPTPRRSSRAWGQPPGMLRENTSPVNTGPGRGHAAASGRGRNASTGPSLDVGGYQVYYDTRSETRLRAWRDQGITELFLPLPGTRQLMICPLEIALRRESGQCRLLPPDAPELADIGDGREVINMQQVYRRGERVWSGPGPYR